MVPANVCMRTFNLTRKHFTYVTVTRHVNLGRLLRLSPKRVCIAESVCGPFTLIADCLSPDRQDVRTAKDGRVQERAFLPMLCMV